MAIGFLIERQDERSELAKARMSGSESYLSEVLASITGPWSTVFNRVGEIIEILDETASPKVRAAAAMALADVNATEAIAPLITVLQRPDIAKSSGTLLYALSKLGGSIPLGLLVSLIQNGSFEGRAEALTFLEEGRIDRFGVAAASAARSALKELAGGNAETASAAEMALHYLEHGRGDGS